MKEYMHQRFISAFKPRRDKKIPNGKLPFGSANDSRR